MDCIRAHDKAILEAAYQRDAKPDKKARLDIVARVSMNEKEVQLSRALANVLAYLARIFPAPVLQPTPTPPLAAGRARGDAKCPTAKFETDQRA